jgi:cellulose biosynthesis protein BcsQ
MPVYTVANNKGGQGKTFLSTLLCLCLLENEKTANAVIAVDLDQTQRSLSDNLKKSKIELVHQIPTSFQQGKVYVIDTPPNIHISTPAIKSADYVIVPVADGKHSVHGLNSIAKIREKNDLRVVINEWNGHKQQVIVEEYLGEHGYKVVAKLPKYLRVMNNVDSYASWYAGLTAKQFEVYRDGVQNILKG